MTIKIYTPGPCSVCGNKGDLFSSSSSKSSQELCVKCFYQSILTEKEIEAEEGLDVIPDHKEDSYKHSDQKYCPPPIYSKDEQIIEALKQVISCKDDLISNLKEQIAGLKAAQAFPAGSGTPLAPYPGVVPPNYHEPFIGPYTAPGPCPPFIVTSHNFTSEAVTLTGDPLGPCDVRFSGPVSSDGVLKDRIVIFNDKAAFSDPNK